MDEEFVLKAIQSYHLMLMSLNKICYNKLKKVCRKFLWGTNDDGKPKKAIIAWNEITHTKEAGGLDIRTFELQALALKLRSVTQILQNRNVEWVWMAKENL